MEVQESKQVGGTHYSCMKYQPIDLIIKLDLDFIQGCIVKYLSRHKNKNGKEDIEKAIQYMEFGLKSGKRMEKKYILTDIKKEYDGHILYRIKALKNFTLINGKEIQKGDLGGWVESEDNLSQEGLCWIYDECKMYENARRRGHSIGYGNSQQFGDSQQYENSQQFGDSQQFENSLQSENSKQYGNSRQYGNSQQYGNSSQYGNSRQYGNSQQFGNSRQYGNSQQFGHSYQSGNSKQFGVSKADKDMRLSGNSLFETKDDVVILTSPTSGRQITIGLDKNICTGCFDGSSWWLIDENRCQLPEDHWAFSLHKQLLEGKFKDIKL